MNKKEFLKALENELIKLDVQDITNILEYYDEYIEDQIENGKKEKEVIDGISMYDIIKETRAHKKINEATEKPSISNGMKALIAFLGILSFPMLITVGAVLFALLVAMLAIIFAVVVTFGALFVAGIITIVVLIGSLIFGQLTFFAALFGLGIMLVLVGIFGMLVKWTIIASQEIMAWFIKLINRKFRKRSTNHE